MKQLDFPGGVYRTDPAAASSIARLFPGLWFYARYIGICLAGAHKAKRGRYPHTEWWRSSYDVLKGLEKVGVQVEIAGIEHLERMETPFIVVANHMSVLETNVLPVVIQPIRNVTFVVKQSLLEYPVFGHILGSRDPIVVTRTNPRHDLKAVLEGGTQRLNSGTAIIIFPQTTRTLTLEPEKFTSLGVKLALRAGVPIIPLALSTAAWGNGKFVKEFGKIDPAKKVRFAFGAPIHVQGRGADEHEAIIQFITGKLREWEGP